MIPYRFHKQKGTTMRHAMAALFGALALGATAHAATTPEVWQGTSFIETATSACTTADVTSVGDYYTTVYRPIISGTQNGPEGLSFIGARAGQFWSTLSAGSSFENAALANILTLSSHASSAFASSGGGYSLIINGVGSPTVTITGLLSNFWAVAGCNVTISAALARRP